MLKKKEHLQKQADEAAALLQANNDKIDKIEREKRAKEKVLQDEVRVQRDTQKQKLQEKLLKRKAARAAHERDAKKNEKIANDANENVISEMHSMEVELEQEAREKKKKLEERLKRRNHH